MIQALDEFCRTRPKRVVVLGAMAQVAVFGLADQLLLGG